MFEGVVCKAQCDVPQQLDSWRVLEVRGVETNYADHILDRNPL